MASKRRLRRKACNKKQGFQNQTEAVKNLIGLKKKPLIQM